MSKRLDKLLSRSQEMADELKAKEEAKAKIDKEIEKLQMQELKNFLAVNHMKLDGGFYDTALLVKEITESGISLDDIRKMVGIPVTTSSQIETKLRQEIMEDKKKNEKQDN